MLGSLGCKWRTNRGWEAWNGYGDGIGLSVWTETTSHKGSGFNISLTGHSQARKNHFGKCSAQYGTYWASAKSPPQRLLGRVKVDKKIFMRTSRFREQIVQ